MKTFTWIGWLIIACISLSEARYKIRRPLPPPPSHQIFKKAWPISHRMSAGNPIHISGNFHHKRGPYKPSNLRMRRPSVFNVIPTTWKSQGQMLGALNNYAVLPQRPPVKEFHTMNKVTEYSTEYRPETIVLPPTHRGGIDDDKGPIHTIPAPNLSPADKPFNLEATNQEVKIDYTKNIQGTSVTPQRTVTSPAPTQHHYEVTETNEINARDYYTIQPTYFTPEFDTSKLSTAVAPDLQSDEIYRRNQPTLNTGLIDTNVQFGQSNGPMQTNLHSSLHVGFPGTAIQAPSATGNQVPDLHVGHPAPAGSPLSATQLYDLLNSFPQQLTDQYTSGQHPQLQQHILQQQLGHLLQPTANGATSFSQPQMHSFNYEEQANKYPKQQQVLFGQNYAHGRITTDYNLESEVPADLSLNNNLRQNDDLINYVPEATDQHENRIEYEQTSNQRKPSIFFTKVGNGDSISTQFYTTLPNKEAAEKLAALAAAGNVNSHLIGQLRKQQEMQQNEAPMPSNHKDESYEVNEQQDDNAEVQYDQKRYEQQQQQQQQQFYQRQKQLREQHQVRREQELNGRLSQQRYNQQQSKEERKKHSSKSQEQNSSLKIMVPETEEYRDDLEHQSQINEDYDYENDEATETQATSSEDDAQYETQDAEFGTRLSSKTGRS